MPLTGRVPALRLAGRRDKAVFLVSSDFPLSEKEANGWDNLRLTAAALRQSLDMDRIYRILEEGI